MKRYKLSDCGDRGWFIGDFTGAIYQTKDFEVNYQKNPRSQTPSHIHKVAHEITLIVKGRQICNGEIFEAGEICILEPGDISQIEYLEETETVTIKVPSVPTDKHYL
jgi:uncharacterized cupin superfamily protein